MKDQISQRLVELFFQLKKSGVEGSCELVEGVESAAKGGGRCLEHYIVEKFSGVRHFDMYWGFLIFDLLLTMCMMIDWEGVAKAIVEGEGGEG
jgi:hypothetical protein